MRLRHSVAKASAAKQRKGKKLAKKDVTWKSKLKKDPGIPNLFPYKDKILAEIEENRRRKDEETARRKALAKAQDQGLEVSADAMEDDGDAVEDEEDALDLVSEDDNFMQVVRTSVFEPGVSALMSLTGGSQPYGSASSLCTGPRSEVRQEVDTT